MAGKSWRGTNWLVVVLAAGLYAGAGWQIVAAAMLGGVWLWPSLIAPMTVSQLLGHANLKTLAHYLQTTVRDLQQAHAKTKPGK